MVHNHNNHVHNHEVSHAALWRIIISIILYAALHFVDLEGWTRLAVYLGVYLIIGYDVIIKAFRGIFHGELFDENFLMLVATAGVFGLALHQGTGDYIEAISVMLFFQIGEFFLCYAIDRSREKIEALLKDNLVFANEGKGSRSESFITRFAHIYTPIVCLCALGLLLLPPLVSLGMGLDADWDIWIYRALTFLVISCPCALVISIPLSFFAGIGCASSEGILVKGSNQLEFLNRVKRFVSDNNENQNSYVGIKINGEEAYICENMADSDLILTDNDPKKMDLAMRISHKCMGIVWQNIIMAIGVKVICLILGAFGFANMWLAVFADTGIMIIAVLNALRALTIKK